MFVKFKIMIMLSLFFNQQYKVKQILIFTTNVQNFFILLLQKAL